MTDSVAEPRFALAGRRALITGGSLGIGRAIALGLAGAGAAVAIQYESAADAHVGRANAASELEQELGAGGRPAAAIAADFSAPGEAGRSYEAATAALGPIDILVLSASVQRRTAFVDVSRDELAHQVAVNFAATVELLQAAVPAMATRGWGRVLAIGSVNQVRPDPELAVYAALKSAQHNLIANLARSYAGQGVTFNTLSPGLIATERNRQRRDDPETWAAIERAANPMARAGSPDDMVGAALLFCSEAGGFLTGVDLQATGGGHL